MLWIDFILNVSCFEYIIHLINSAEFQCKNHNYDIRDASQMTHTSNIYYMWKEEEEQKKTSTNSTFCRYTWENKDVDKMFTWTPHAINKYDSLEFRLKRNRNGQMIACKTIDRLERNEMKWNVPCSASVKTAIALWYELMEWNFA